MHLAMTRHVSGRHTLFTVILPAPACRGSKHERSRSAGSECAGLACTRGELGAAEGKDPEDLGATMQLQGILTML